jgi:hypothetical protein
MTSVRNVATVSVLALGARDPPNDLKFIIS